MGREGVYRGGEGIVIRCGFIGLTEVEPEGLMLIREGFLQGGGGGGLLRGARSADGRHNTICLPPCLRGRTRCNRWAGASKKTFQTKQEFLMLWRNSLLGSIPKKTGLLLPAPQV